MPHGGEQLAALPTRALLVCTPLSPGTPGADVHRRAPRCTRWCASCSGGWSSACPGRRGG